MKNITIGGNSTSKASKAGIYLVFHNLSIN